jgi:hypothetical protein
MVNFKAWLQGLALDLPSMRFLQRRESALNAESKSFLANIGLFLNPPDLPAMQKAYKLTPGIYHRD